MDFCLVAIVGAIYSINEKKKIICLESNQGACSFWIIRPHATVVIKCVSLLLDLLEV